MGEDQEVEQKPQQGYIASGAKITLKVLGVGFAATILYFGLAVPARERAENQQSEREFMSTYRQALRDYADENRDGLISRMEADEFDRRLLHDKQVTLLPGETPKYKDGRAVPLEILTQWIQMYGRAHTTPFRGPGNGD